MSEKFLGYYAVGGKAGKKKVIVKKPVRLASESVDLRKFKEWIRKNQYTEWDGKCSCGKEFTISHPNELKYISVSDLLVWAEKEAKKK